MDRPPREAPPQAVALQGEWLRDKRLHHLGNWKCVKIGEDGEAWEGMIKGQPLIVIWSLAYEEDLCLWLHVSCSHRARVPTWDEMSAVKERFIGLDRWAAQLHPPSAEHINIHDRCLHLFAPWSPETWPMPDFTRGSGSI